MLESLLIDRDTESVKTYLRNVTGLIKPSDRSCRPMRGRELVTDQVLATHVVLTQMFFKTAD